MIFGEPIEIDRYFSKDTVFPSFFDVVAHKEADPNEEYQNQLTHKMDLLAAGANGDAAAAIAYCKLISDNEEYVC
jgi:hypothetical protein